jgi:S1-C subfamily serine protease
MRRLRFGALAVLLAIGMLPAVGGVAQERARPVSEVMESSVFIIGGLECETEPAPDGDPFGIPVAETCEARWSGSGTIVTPDGLVLTNAHVALDEERGEPTWTVVGLTVDPRELPQLAFFARAVYYDAALDLAIMAPFYTLSGEPIAQGDLALPPLEMPPDVQAMGLEDNIRLIGYPGIGGPTVSFYTGRVTGFSRDPANPELGNSAWTETDASAGPGVSGGTAINDLGQLVGVPTQGTGGTLNCEDVDGDGEPDQGGECIGTGEKIQRVRPIPEGIDELLRRAEAAGQLPGSEEPTPEPEETPEPAETPGPEETPAPEETPEPAETPEPQPTPEPEPTVGAEETPGAEPTQAPRRTLPRRGGEQPDQPDQPDEPVEGGVIVRGRFVSADTSDPIRGATIVVLDPGVTIEEWADADFDPELAYTFAQSDGLGDFQLQHTVERGQGYSVVLAADGYEPQGGDDVVFADEESPEGVAIGTIELEAVQ